MARNRMTLGTARRKYQRAMRRWERKSRKLPPHLVGYIRLPKAVYVRLGMMTDPAWGTQKCAVVHHAPEPDSPVYRVEPSPFKPIQRGAK